VNRRFVLWVVLLVASLATACSEETYDDLEVFVKDAGEGLRGKVDSLPEIQPLERFVYQAFEIPDPFSSQKNKQDKADQNELQPDLKRPREALENYPLENLIMVGTLQRGRSIFALIKAPDNTVHRVKTGNYLGQNFGLITGISEGEVTLKEIIREDGNDWAEHVGVLMLQTQEQN